MKILKIIMPILFILVLICSGIYIYSLHAVEVKTSENSKITNIDTQNNNISDSNNISDTSDTKHYEPELSDTNDNGDAVISSINNSEIDNDSASNEYAKEGTREYELESMNMDAFYEDNIYIKNAQVLFDAGLEFYEQISLQAYLSRYLIYYGGINNNDKFKGQIKDDLVTNNGDKYYYNIIIDTKPYEIQCVYNKKNDSYSFSCAQLEKQYKINQLGQEEK